MIPYVGDIAKLGKISRCTTSLQKTIRLARKRDGQFRVVVKALTGRILAAIRKIPVDKLPQPIRNSLDKLEKIIAHFHIGNGLRLSRMEKLTNETLRHIFRSTKNIGMLPRKNIKTIVEFFTQHKVGDGQPTKWAELIKGIDLHAVDAVEVIPMRSDEVFRQYIEVARPANRRVGRWMRRTRGAVSHRSLGLYEAGREPHLYRLKSNVKMLKSKAACAADHWTVGGNKPHKAVTRD